MLSIFSNILRKQQRTNPKLPIVRNFPESPLDWFPLWCLSPHQYFLEEEEILSQSSPSGLWWSQTYQGAVCLGHEQRARLFIHLVKASCFLPPGAKHEGHRVAFSLSLSQIICSRNRCDNQNQARPVAPDQADCLMPILVSSSVPGGLACGEGREHVWSCWDEPWLLLWKYGEKGHRRGGFWPPDFPNSHEDVQFIYSLNY